MSKVGRGLDHLALGTPFKVEHELTSYSLSTQNLPDVCEVSFFLSLSPKCDTIVSS